MTVDAPNREDAVRQLQGMMTQEGLDQHFRERHNPSEQKPTLEQAHAAIASVTAAA
jgi:hypothetical protein